MSEQNHYKGLQGKHTRLLFRGIFYEGVVTGIYPEILRIVVNWDTKNAKRIIEIKPSYSDNLSSLLDDPILFFNTRLVFDKMIEQIRNGETISNDTKPIFYMRIVK